MLTVQSELEGNQVNEEMLAYLARKAVLVMQVGQALKVCKGQGVWWDDREYQGNRALLGNEGYRGLTADQANLARKGCKDHLGLWAGQVNEDYK